MSESEQLSVQAARQFAEKYKDATSEKQLGQSFWRDFFQSVVGVADLLVTGIEFEKPVRSSAGTINFIDCFWDGVVLVEHKSAGKDLNLAEQQAREYLGALPASERPPTIIVSDFKTIRVVEVIKGTSIEFQLADLPDNLGRISSVVSYQGKMSAAPRVEADKNAVKLMGQLFAEFEKAGYGGHELSVFLIRILFLNFGDDTRMWKFTPDGLFGSYVQNTYADGSGLGGRIQELFQVLNTPFEKRPGTLSPALGEFPYVNGGLFAEQLPIFSFTDKMREALIATTHYDWSSISPAIFGAMFQTVKDKAKRRESGEFFTSEKAIMRVISPLFLDDFNDRLQKGWASPTSLKKLRVELGKKSYLDPASGSGNFLIVAYKRLRELELKIIVRLRELEGRDTEIQIDGSLGLQVHLGQFHAIEYDEWSSQIAFVAMFLADHQANIQMEEFLGASPERFPLTESAVVKQGNALLISWDSVCPMNENTYIMGNPPFNGSTWMSDEQREDTARIWEGTARNGILDYVSNWFLLASKWSQQSGAKCAFVATNSVTQGQQPAIIWSRLRDYGVGIDFAYRSFLWDNGASVHVVIIGFSCSPKSNRLPLWHFSDIRGEPSLVIAKQINAYLMDAPDLLITPRTLPLLSTTPKVVNGSKPADGGFLSNISFEEAEEIKEKDPIAAKYLRRLIGSQELIQEKKRYCLWLVDAEPSDIRKSEVLSSRVEGVRAMRLASKDKSTIADASRPTEFQKIRQPAGKFIGVPEVSSETREYIPIALFEPEVIPTNKVQVIQDDGFFHFGVLISKVFSVWVQSISGRLGSSFSISAEITYNNFPFPNASAAQSSIIEERALTVLDVRGKFKNSSLADLYEPIAMPPELRKAHQQLDKVVLEAYGLRTNSTEVEILADLFKRYDELTRGLLEATPTPKPRKTRAK
jgi:hypothetical protein